MFLYRSPYRTYVTNQRPGTGPRTVGPELARACAPYRGDWPPTRRNNTGVCERIVASVLFGCVPSRGPSLFQCCAHAALECKVVRNNRRRLHGLLSGIANFDIGGPRGLTGNECETCRGRRLFRTHQYHFSKIEIKFWVWDEGSPLQCRPRWERG